MVTMRDDGSSVIVSTAGPASGTRYARFTFASMAMQFYAAARGISQPGAPVSSIRCPYCQHGMQLKGAKPGRYGPRCAACGKKFLLIVPDDPKQAMKVATVAEKPSAAAAPA